MKSLRPGNSQTAVNQAAGTPRISVSVPTPSMRIRELTTYSARTVRQRCPHVAPLSAPNTDATMMSTGNATTKARTGADAATRRDAENGDAAIIAGLAMSVVRWPDLSPDRPRPRKTAGAGG